MMRYKGLIASGCLMLGALGTTIPAGAQRVAKAHKAVKLKRHDIAPANYSGISPLGGDRYAVVSDKEKQDGYYEFRIRLDSLSGRVRSVERTAFRGTAPRAVSASGISLRDCEGVAYQPATGLVFVSGEGDQAIIGYDRAGNATTQLPVPAAFGPDRIRPNYGFEALACDTARNLFWTVTENALPADAPAGVPEQPALRLLCIAPDGTATAYAYRMEAKRKARSSRLSAHGVVALTVLPDGRLLALERQVNVPKNYVGTRCDCRLFVIDPLRETPLPTPDAPLDGEDIAWLQKRELWKKTTRFNLTRRNFANYEGMCTAPPLPDGRIPLLLINDSQAGLKKGPVRMKDYLTVLLLEETAP